MIKRRILTDTITCMLLAGIAFIGFAFALGQAPRDSAAYKFTYIDTDKIDPGTHKIVVFQGTPIVFSKLSNGSVASFIALSNYSECHLQYAPPGALDVNWNGGWIDPCSTAIWDNEGKFISGKNSGVSSALDNLPSPNMLSWQGNTAVLNP